VAISLRALKAEFRHHKLINERVNHTAHMIGWHKIVQHHRKQCSLTPSLALDVTHRRNASAYATASSHLPLFKNEAFWMNVPAKGSTPPTGNFNFNPPLGVWEQWNSEPT
jgi:hypothetical protein